MNCHRLVETARWVVCTVLLSVPAVADTWQVPADAATIQGGIDLAAYGDAVELAAGDYFEHSIIMKAGVTLRPAAGAEGAVTIHGLGEVGIWFQNIDFCEVRGLAFVGCGKSALRMVYASPLIEGCHFEGNHFTDGGAIHMIDSRPTVINCKFLGNSATHAGGAMAMGRCQVTVQGCTFGGLGGAIDVESGSTLLILGSVLENNVARSAGGALNVWQNTGTSSIRVHDSSIMNNVAPAGSDGWADDGCLLTVNSSNLDPLFATTFAGPGTVLVDGMVVALAQRTWGEVKLEYR